MNDQQKFRLNKGNEIKDYFIAEIRERELISKRLSKYIASFAYFDKPLIVLTVCFYHVTYAFQSESTLYSCLNVKELLARSRREI